MIFNNSEAWVNFSASAPPLSQSINQPVPKSAATTGEPIIANNVTTDTTNPNDPDTFATNSRVLFKSLSELYSARTGTNALEKAPSANKRRRKLGMRLAKRKTSDIAPAPSTLATIISRIKPNTREMRVSPLTNTPDFRSFLLIVFSS